MTLYKKLKTIISAPKDPEKEYVLCASTYKDIWAMAADFQNRLFDRNKHISVCMCTTDRAVTAAALLAALTRPATLIMPHEFSDSVIEKVYRENGFSKAVLEKPVNLPGNAEAIYAKPGSYKNNILDTSFIRNPDEVFVKLFTGGSTGAPRTWSKTIGNLFFEAMHHVKKMNISPEDVFAATVPPNHIYGLLFSVLAPLVAGASTVDGLFTYPHEIQKGLSGFNATTLVSIPLHYKMLSGINLSAPWLSRALCSAARLFPEDSRAFYEKTGIGVTEIYGSTETGGIATRLCTSSQTHFTALDCIKWKLVKNRLAICSDFISPELPVDKDGYYITSDQVSIAGPNGFSLKGRADRIVKVGGKRVDLDEIRSVIMDMPEVKDAAIVCVPDKGGRGNEIRALAATCALPAEIRRHLIRHLPGHAIPRKIKTSEKIPVSAAGKYDNTAICDILDS